jgi:hypothetical protein
VGALALSSCYIQGQGGFYKTSYTAGTSDVSTLETGGTGLGWGLSTGIEVSFGVKGQAVQASLGVGGASVASGDIDSAVVGMDIDGAYRFLRLGQHGGLFAMASGRFFSTGGFVIPGEPEGDEGHKSTGAFDFWAGAGIAWKPDVGHWNLAAGLAVGSRETSTYGSISSFGVEARLRYTWIPRFLRPGGGGGGGGGQSSFVVDMPGSDNVIPGLGRAMQNYGCTDVGPNEAGGVVGNCRGVRVGVLQSSSQLIVVCDSSEANCRATFQGILNSAQ